MKAIFVICLCWFVVVACHVDETVVAEPKQNQMIDGCVFQRVGSIMVRTCG